MNAKCGDKVVIFARVSLLQLSTSKLYSYISQKLTILFDSLIMSHFKYAKKCVLVLMKENILVPFCKQAVKFGYTSQYTSIKDLKNVRDQGPVA